LLHRVNRALGSSKLTFQFG